MSFHNFNINVYLEDTDALGIVYYANYLKYIERARHDFFKTNMMNHCDLIDSGYMFVVREIHMEFKKPAKLDDILIVRTTMGEKTKYRLSLRQKIEKDGTNLVIANVDLVLVNKELKLMPLSVVL